MKIKYTNTEEDVVCFGLHCRENSPTHKRIMRSARLLIPAFITIYFLLECFNDGNLFHIFEGLFLSGVYIVIFSLASKQGSNKITKKLYAEGKNKGIFCEHEIEIIDVGIVETTNVGKQESYWATIEKIEETDEHLFIYTGSMTAHVIPKSRVEGDLDLFTKILREKTAQQIK
jgi:hypothetical protein